MSREKRLYELFFDKNTWVKRMTYLLVGFIIAPLIIGLQCEYQKHMVRQKEGVYAK